MFETIINLKPKDQWRVGVTVTRCRRNDKALQFQVIQRLTMPIRRASTRAVHWDPYRVHQSVWTDSEMERLSREVEQS